MIGREEERSLAAGGGDSFESVDLEPGSDERVYPARADLPATPAPESLPATLIHPANQTERRAFERGQGVELRSTGIPADSHPANPGVRLAKRVNPPASSRLAAIEERDPL